MKYLLLLSLLLWQPLTAQQEGTEIKQAKGTIVKVGNFGFGIRRFAVTYDDVDLQTETTYTVAATEEEMLGKQFNWESRAIRNCVLAHIPGDLDPSEGKR